MATNNETKTPLTDEAADYTAPEKLHRLCKKFEREIAELKEQLTACHNDVIALQKTSVWRLGQLEQRDAQLRLANDDAEGLARCLDGVKSFPLTLDDLEMIEKALADHRARIKGESNDTRRTS